MAIVGYRPPGVYTRVRFIPTVARVAGAILTPAIIGEATNDLIVQEENVVRQSIGLEDTLSNLFVQEITEIRDRYGRIYTEVIKDPYTNDVLSGDYELQVDTQTGTSKIVWQNGQQPPSQPDTYFASYTALKPDTAYDPIVFFNPLDAENIYGTTDIDDLGNVVNPLTLGIQLAFGAGSSQVVGVQVKNPNPLSNAPTSAWQDALDKLKLQNVDIVIPLTTDEVVRTMTLNHIVLMSSTQEKKRRRAIFAPPRDSVISNTNPSDPPGIIEIAKGIKNRRAALIAPTKYLIDLTNIETQQQQTVEVDGTFVAASISGTLVSQDVATPLTRKPVVGFRNVIENYLEIEKNILASNGIMVIENKGRTLRIRHSLSTDVASVLSKEFTIIGIVDLVSTVLEDRLDRLFIGIKNTPTAPLRVRQATGSILNDFKQGEIIRDYRNVNAVFLPNQPDTIRVTAQIAPIFPLNYIDIDLTVSAA